MELQDDHGSDVTMASVSFLQCSITSFVAGLVLVSTPALANDDGAPFLHAPASGTEIPRAAAIYNLKLHLANGRGLVQSLLDTGVMTDDAQLAGRLAASALKDKASCAVTVSLSRTVEADGFRLERVVLVTAASQTVLERRNGQLAVADQARADAHAPIV